MTLSTFGFGRERREKASSSPAGEISNASPGEHEVARLLKPHDALTVEELKGGAQVGVRREVLVGVGSAFLNPVLVIGLGMFCDPNVRVLCGLLDAIVRVHLAFVLELISSLV